MRAVILVLVLLTSSPVAAQPAPEWGTGGLDNLVLIPMESEPVPSAWAWTTLALTGASAVAAAAMLGVAQSYQAQFDAAVSRTPIDALTQRDSLALEASASDLRLGGTIMLATAAVAGGFTLWLFLDRDVALAPEVHWRRYEVDHPAPSAPQVGVSPMDDGAFVTVQQRF